MYEKLKIPPGKDIIVITEDGFYLKTPKLTNAHSFTNDLKKYIPDITPEIRKDDKGHYVVEYPPGFKNELNEFIRDKVYRHMLENYNGTKS